MNATKVGCLQHKNILSPEILAEQFSTTILKNGFTLLKSRKKYQMKQTQFQGLQEKREHYVILQIINTFTRQKKSS